MVKILLDEDLIEHVIAIARKAGAAILEVYKTDFKIYTKNDRSPLTEADKWAHKIIMDGLADINPKLPILSEEGYSIPYHERSNWDAYWLVDPMDGTKEFIKKNDEFTVNIALIEQRHPVFGVVNEPALNKIYWGSNNTGSYKIIKNKNPEKITVKSQITSPVQIAVSRSHPNSKMNEFVDQFDDYNLIPMGSSLKICSVSDGTVHFYPRFGPTMEWDTAASHAIVNGAGGELINIKTNNPLEYNKENLLNPMFIAGNIKALHSINLLKFHLNQ